MMCIMSDLKQHLCFFIQIPLKDQLVRLLEDDRIYSILQEGLTSNQSDVHSDRVYKRLVRNNIISERVYNSITMEYQWNTNFSVIQSIFVVYSNSCK